MVISVAKQTFVNAIKISPLCIFVDVSLYIRMYVDLNNCIVSKGYLHSLDEITVLN